MLLVEIISPLSVVDTGTTGGGEIFFVGSGASDDRSKVASDLVTN